MEKLSSEEILSWRETNLRHLEAGSVYLTTLLIGCLISSTSPLEALLGKITNKTDQMLALLASTGGDDVNSSQCLAFSELVAAAASDAAVRQGLLDGATIAEVRDKCEYEPWLATFDAFVDEYGHRGPNETDEERPRYCEEPDLLVRQIARQLKLSEPVDFSAVLDRSRKRHVTALETARELCGRAYPWPVSKAAFGAIRFFVRKCRRYFRYREANRSWAMKAGLLRKRAHQAIAAHWLDDGLLRDGSEIYLLTEAEIARAVGEDEFRAGIPDIITSRKAERERLAARQVPDHFTGMTLPEGQTAQPTPPEPSPPGSRKGMAASPGIAVGKARLCRTVEDLARIERGDILVAPAIDPAWTQALGLVGGVAAELGGVLSHGLIVVREYGLPAVVNVPGLLDTLEDGQEIRVDGDNGRIEVLRDESR